MGSLHLTKVKRIFFVHISALEKSGLSDLADDQKVSFEISSGRDGRQAADNIELQ